MIRNLSAALVTVVIAASSNAMSQPSGASAQAEVLFRKAKELMTAGKTAEACATFDASQKLEATISTRMNQANCREKNGQLATSWGLFLEAERQTRAADDVPTKQLHQVAVDRAAKLESRMSSIRFAVSAGNRIAGLEVLRDNEVVDPATWNTKLPVDGGTYTIIARAPGAPTWTSTIVLATERDVKTVEIPKLEPKRTDSPATVAVTKPVDTKPGEPRPVEPRPVEPAVTPAMTSATPPVVEGAHSALTGRRKLALGVAGVGVVAVAIGATFGLSAQTKQKDAQDLCPDPQMPCANAVQATALTKAGHDKAVQANIAFGVGAAALIGAGVLWITGKPDETRRVTVVPHVTRDQSGIAVMGRF